MVTESILMFIVKLWWDEQKRSSDFTENKTALIWCDVWMTLRQMSLSLFAANKTQTFNIQTNSPTNATQSICQV